MKRSYLYEVTWTDKDNSHAGYVDVKYTRKELKEMVDYFYKRDSPIIPDDVWDTPFTETPFSVIDPYYCREDNPWEYGYDFVFPQSLIDDLERAIEKKKRLNQIWIINKLNLLSQSIRRRRMMNLTNRINATGK